MDWFGMAALVTASLGGLATLVVAVATLVASLRQLRLAERTERAINGRLDELLAEARQGAFAQGVEEGRRLESLRHSALQPPAGPPAPPV